MTKLKIYSFLGTTLVNGIKNQQGILIVSHTLDEAFVKAKELVDTKGVYNISLIGSFGYDQIVQMVNVKEKIKDKTEDDKIKIKYNHRRSIAFLKVILDKYGDKKIKTIIREIERKINKV